MNPLELAHKKNLICDKNDYYSDKFDELKLKIRLNNFNNATSDLKDDFIIIGTDHSNILVQNKFTGETNFIKKEHFEDYLDDDEKEELYRHIKKYVTAISKANQILKNWYESLLDINENYYKDITIPLNDSLFNLFYYYRNELYKFSLYASSPIQPHSLPALDSSFDGKYPPKEAVEFLYQLCNGDIKLLEAFSKLSYNLIYNSKDCLATVILVNKEIHEELREYFNLLTYPRFTNWFNELGLIDFKTMRLKDNRTILLEHEFKKDLPIILVNGDTIYRKGEVHSFFKKLFTGKKLKIKSPYFDDELNLINTIPIVCLIDDEKKYRAIKNLYKINGIEIKSKELSVPEKSSGSADWLRREFLYIGQKQVKINPKMAIPYEANYEKIVKRFLRTCCTFGNGKDCTKRDLHKAFEEYLEHCYPDEERITQRALCGIVLQLKCERLIVKRIHDGRNKPSLEHFIGMALKENYSELSLEEPVNRRAENKKEEFGIFLNKLVDETFKDVQLNKRRVSKTIDIIR